MNSQFRNYQRRYEALKIKTETLSTLRRLVALPPEHDITKRQWSILESQLSAAEARIQSKLKRATKQYLPQVDDPQTARRLNAIYGEIEMELSRAFPFFDTYMDILTQRHTPEIGPLLAGCDVLARDALKKDHPALDIVESPLVYCDRGFGASVLREGVLLPDLTPNPMPLIQIPYSRLKEKYNLTSILHEAGHEVMVRLGLITSVPKALRHALGKAGAPDSISELYALWTKEIDPDFWTFCASGIAEAAGTRDILSLPPALVFRISWMDPHPPPYLRTLLSFDWCRQVWGKGDWDNWEKEWLELYPLKDAPIETQVLLKKFRKYIPVVSRTLLYTKFRVLSGRTIPDLFNLSALAPVELRRIALTADSGALDLKGLSPCAQLAVFRLIREQGKLKEEMIDRIMTKWLLKLGEGRKVRVKK
jgi:hypothetical protein